MQQLPALTIALGAFLLFQLQPMMAKAILPWFGGSAAVWNMCMLFFQGVLFLGYGYAHGVTRSVPARAQSWVHGGLLVASLAFLPVLPAASWKPTSSDSPAIHILLLLGACVGLPYFLLTTTSPLLQAWLARRGEVVPYRYFALSNFASFVALLGYPFWIEPYFTLEQQSVLWSGGYVVYAVACGSLVWMARGQAVRAGARESAGAGAERVPVSRQVLWLILPACASVLSLSVTSHLCQNVAPIPFLWVLPLSAYLLSFVVCFEREGWYRRRVFVPLHGMAMAAAGYVLLGKAGQLPVSVLVPGFSGALFVWCVFFHGEMARLKPAAAGLTKFYLMMSLGGVLGAAVVSVGAPLVLAGSYDLPVGLAVAGFLTLMLGYGKSIYTDVAWTGVAVFLVVVAGGVMQSTRNGATVLSRNFYGSLRVVEEGSGNGAQRMLVHGVTNHGAQLLARELRHTATTYYAEGTGGQVAIASFRKPAQKVGVIGLGVGTLAVYGETGDRYRFYELNPAVEEIARSQFSFLKDAKAEVEVVIGDGRLSLEREAEQQFDVLVVDAFSGDAIPAHLLTRESVQLYLRHIRPDGVIALHVSNASLDVAKVAHAVAGALGKPSLEIRTEASAAAHRSASVWVLIGQEERVFEKPGLRGYALRKREEARVQAWTDSYSSLFPILLKAF